MAVAYDNSVALVDGSSSPQQLTLTIGSGNVGGMVLLTFDDGHNVSAISVTGAGGAWNLVANSDSGDNGAGTFRTMIYGSAGLGSGSQTVTVSWTGSALIAFAVVTATNVNQSTPVIHGTAYWTAGSGVTPSITITTANGNMTVDIVRDLGHLSSPTQTVISNSNGYLGSSYELSTGSSNTHQWSLSQSSQLAQSGADFLFSAAIVTPLPPLLGRHLDPMQQPFEGSILTRL